MQTSFKPVVLVFTILAPEDAARMATSAELIEAPTDDARRQAVAEHGHRIDVLLTIGSIGLTRDEIAAMPKLALISALGAGFEKIDIEAARERAIPVVNGAGSNDQSVADHTFALLLAAVRDIKTLDQQTRAGIWRTELPIKPGISGKRLGILGLGTIGQHIARRARAFDLAVGYHNRRERPDAGDAAYFASPVALAKWADFLIVATPGGPGTRHLVDAAVLAALGARGFLVNIARGSVVDTQALGHALRNGVIGGAGLDVYESEPAPPTALFDCPNLVLTPHVAGWSPEAIEATVTCFLDNLARLGAGQPLRNLV